PMPAIVPSARRAVMPEMNTRRPRASIMVACEKCPLGWRSLLLVICCLGMGVLVGLRDEFLWRGDAECAGTREQSVDGGARDWARGLVPLLGLPRAVAGHADAGDVRRASRAA